MILCLAVLIQYRSVTDTHTDTRRRHIPRLARRRAVKTGVFCQIFPVILDLFSQSFHHMKAICTDDGSVFFSKSGQLLSSNIGVYAVKTCNFCRHAPAILGRSSYVMLAFRNALEDRNFDFSRVIGKHLCTPYRNLVRFGLVTPEFKT